MVAAWNNKKAGHQERPIYEFEKTASKGSPGKKEVILYPTLHLAWRERERERERERGRERERESERVSE